jgi:hypothetical protein
MADWSLQTLAGSLQGVRASLAAGLAGLAPEGDRERVEAVQFGTLEYQACVQCAQSARLSRRVLLLAYNTGFQARARARLRTSRPAVDSVVCSAPRCADVRADAPAAAQVWDLEGSRSIPELVSRRDGPVRCAAGSPARRAPAAQWREARCAAVPEPCAGRSVPGRAARLDVRPQAAAALACSTAGPCPCLLLAQVPGNDGRCGNVTVAVRGTLLRDPSSGEGGAPLLLQAPSAQSHRRCWPCRAQTPALNPPAAGGPQVPGGAAGSKTPALTPLAARGP